MYMSLDTLNHLTFPLSMRIRVLMVVTEMYSYPVSPLMGHFAGVPIWGVLIVMRDMV